MKIKTDHVADHLSFGAIYHVDVTARRDQSENQICDT